MSDQLYLRLMAFATTTGALAMLLCGCRALSPKGTGFVPAAAHTPESQAATADESASVGRWLESPLRITRLPAVIESGFLPASQRFVQLVSHTEPQESAASEEVGVVPSQEEPRGDDILDGQVDGEDIFPIDLANALALGGASSVQIQLARERVLEAEAKYRAAKVMWLPSLRVGLSWARHDGQLQATEGHVIPAGRNSLFVGGGAGLGNVPVLGGAGGPPRMFVNLSIADAYFEPLAAHRQLAAEGAAESAGMNDALLEIAVAYFELAEAYSMLSNATVALSSARELAELTRLFAREGAVSMAEVDRAETELAHWEQAAEETKRQAIARSTELVRILRLDPHQALVPVEEQLMPIDVVPVDIHRDGLLAQGLTSRPELAKYSWVVDATLARLQQEHWRPLLPHVQVGATGGTFGGGPSGTFADQKGRGDLELIAVWELKNLGAGNHAAIRQRAAEMRQAEHRAEMTRDKIIAEIVTASSDVDSYRRQMTITQRSVSSASASFERNLRRIREGEGIPLELIQALRARAAAQDAHTRAVSDYNRAQYRLLRAIGVPPGIPAVGDLAIPPDAAS